MVAGMGRDEQMAYRICSDRLVVVVCVVGSESEIQGYGM